MSSQRFSASQREALWLAYDKKCAYTRELLDISSFHIDHIIPESLVNNPSELERIITQLGLPRDFDVFGYGNLLPSRPGANLQKGSVIFDPAPIQFFLGIAASKKALVEANIERIEKQIIRGRALILLQKCLERGDLDASEVATILEKHTEPSEIFSLLEGMQFANATEIREIAKIDIETLRNLPIRLGQNNHINGVTLTRGENEQIHVRTCQEYNEAIKAGFFALTTFDMKMAAFFEHQCGLLTALEAATIPEVSFIDNPRVGVVDLELLPFSLFPTFGEKSSNEDPSATYQSKVSDGTLSIKRLRQNLLQIVVPGGMGHQLIEAARADFNGDGIEDILLFEYCWATQGTLGVGGIQILTRRCVDGLFEPLAIR
jgi:hypothetical protein